MKSRNWRSFLLNYLCFCFFKLAHSTHLIALKLYKHPFEIHFPNHKPLQIVECHAMRSFAMWDAHLVRAFHELCKIQAHPRVKASLAYEKNETHLDPSIWKCFLNEPPMVKAPCTQSACLSSYMPLTLIFTLHYSKPCNMLFYKVVLVFNKNI